MRIIIINHERPRSRAEIKATIKANRESWKKTLNVKLPKLNNRTLRFLKEMNVEQTKTLALEINKVYGMALPESSVRFITAKNRMIDLLGAMDNAHLAIAIPLLNRYALKYSIACLFKKRSPDEVTTESLVQYLNSKETPKDLAEAIIKRNAEVRPNYYKYLIEELNKQAKQV